MPLGRPTAYTAEIAAEVCARLADGETLRQICRSEHIPPATTVRQWVIDDREGFSVQYARARDLCIESWADEVVEIGDDASNDWMKRAGKDKGGDDESPSWVLNGEHVNRSRLRIESRKWLLSKLKPEKYGEKLELNGNLELKMGDEQLESRVTQLLGKAGIGALAGREGAAPEEA